MKHDKPRQVHINISEFDAIKVGVGRLLFRDPYYLILTTSWPRFFAVAISLYIVANLSFASLFFFVPGSVNNARPDHFIDTFFFSIETMATVGYGVMSPATIYGHTVASLEIIFGMMTIAVITGLVFTRFSRPRGRLLFSRLAVVAPVDGVPTVMLRVVNERNEALADATARMLLLRSHVTSEGTTIRRFVDLPLVRSSTPMLGLSWTLMHVIDEKSPLLGATMESLAAESGFLLVSLSGYDESISASITARRSYRATDLRFGYRLVDVMDISPTGTTVLDMRRFHDVEPVHAGESANPQIS